MTPAHKDYIRSLISQVTEANLHEVCDEIHHHIRPEGHRETIHTIAVSIIDEAAGPGHTLVPQYHLAGVCWTINELCFAPGNGGGGFLSISLPQSLDELCQKEFVDANRKLECGEDMETVSSIVLDLVVLVGELYKLNLVTDDAMKKVYLGNLHCGYKGSDVKAEALCLLLELLATRWEMDPTTRNIDVEWHVRSLLDYVERHDPPSALVNEIRVSSCHYRSVASILINDIQGHYYSIWRASSSIATLPIVTLPWLKPFLPWVTQFPSATELLFRGHPRCCGTAPGLFLP